MSPFIPPDWASVPKTQPAAQAFSLSPDEASKSGCSVSDILKKDPSIEALRPVSLSTILQLEEPDKNELIKHRLLCVFSILLLIGPSGVGKSSLIAGFVIAMLCGLTWFGFEPKKRMRVLFVQAENDQYDLKEMFAGAVGAGNPGLLFDPEALSIVRENKTTGAVFCEKLRRCASEHKPDIIVIDPALAFLGGDASSQRDVGEFLRNFLQPVLDEVHAAAVIVHHTTKGIQTGAKTMTRNDTYAGGGSAEWANVSRVVVTVNPTEINGVIELSVPKRGERLGWRGADSKLVIRKYLRRGDDHRRMSWSEISSQEFEKLDAERVDEFVRRLVNSAEHITATQVKAAGSAADIPEFKIGLSLDRLVSNRRIREDQAANKQGKVYSRMKEE